MAQTEILAAGQTAATATDVTIPPASSATFSIRSATANRAIPGNISLPIRLKVGADFRAVASLSALQSSIPIAAPGVYSVNRELITAYGVDIQVLVDQ